MIFGLPKETKPQENRIALTPAACHDIAAAGHLVLVERNAGAGSGYPDATYLAAGAEVVTVAAEVYDRADLVVKVKAPTPIEFSLLRPGQAICGYLHLVVEPILTAIVLERRIVAIDYETVQTEDGSLPVLAPMSEIAGRMAIQAAARFLERQSGGSGKLLSSLAGAPPCQVVVIGPGTAGQASARLALAMGARVTIIGRNAARLARLQRELPKLEVRAAAPASITAALSGADVLIAAASNIGGQAPRLVSRAMLATMELGSVAVCINADEAGVLETCRHTTHSQPTYVEEGVIHYCVPNMPGAVPVTATQALSAVILPYALTIANNGLLGAILADSALARGVVACAGHITHAGLAAALGKPYTPVEEVVQMAGADRPA